MNKNAVCVVGSINMDITVSTSKMPKQGETVLGEKYRTYPGGKGANQAVAAARLGSDVTMIGAVGDDVFGKHLLTHLQQEGIQMQGVEVLGGVSTGIANIIMMNQDNRIIVAPGANQHVTPEMIEKKKHIIQNSDIVLLQQEIPMRTIQYVVELAYESGVKVVLNPAPFQPLSKSLLEKVTYITPNEIEAEAINITQQNVRIQRKTIITLGKSGVQFVNNNGEKKLVPAFLVPVKDTTGAGDTFNGAFVSQIAKGASLHHAISYANAAAALSVTKIGAQTGMPSEVEVEEFLNNQSQSD